MPEASSVPAAVELLRSDYGLAADEIPEAWRVWDHPEMGEVIVYPGITADGGLSIKAKTILRYADIYHGKCNDGTKAEPVALTLNEETMTYSENWSFDWARHERWLAGKDEEEERAVVDLRRAVLAALPGAHDAAAPMAAIIKDLAEAHRASERTVRRIVDKLVEDELVERLEAGMRAGKPMWSIRRSVL